MTDQDRPAFARVLGQLAVGLRASDVDAAVARVYFDTLRDVPIEFITAGAARLLHASTWFPKPAEWRQAAADVERERRTAQQDVVRRLPQPLCASCGDTGWLQVGAGQTVKGYTSAHRAQPCDCVELRRLELLGHRPMPTLPPGAAVPELHYPAPKECSDTLRKLEAEFGRRLLKVFPSVTIRTDDADA
jgi:hypothetical protein